MIRLRKFDALNVGGNITMVFLPCLWAWLFSMLFVPSVHDISIELLHNYFWDVPI